MKDILTTMIEGEPASPQAVAQVLDHLMAGELDPAFAGAFLCLQMRNGIDGPQLQAALEIMMKYAQTIDVRAADALDNCGTGGDGGKSFNVSTTAAFAIAGAGHTVAKHGNRSVSSKCGSADLLEALGVRLDLTPGEVRRCIDECGIGFMFAPTFHPAMRNAVPVRAALGVRTMFNMLGPLANPARVNFQLIGVFRESLTEIFGAALAAMGKRAYVVYGEDGSDEISLTTRTKVTEVADGSFSSYIFDPRRSGFDLIQHQEIEGGTLELNRGYFERVLRDGAKEPATEMVILNAGFAMHTTGRYDSLEAAFAAARAAIESGRAWEKVERLIAVSQAFREGAGH